MSSLTSPNQTAYLENKFISEGGQIISDILEVINIFKIKGFLLTVDIEKAFDSVNPLFIFHVLGKFGFGKNFIKWIQINSFNKSRILFN